MADEARRVILRALAKQASGEGFRGSRYAAVRVAGGLRTGRLPQRGLTHLLVNAIPASHATLGSSTHLSEHTFASIPLIRLTHR